MPTTRAGYSRMIAAGDGKKVEITAHPDIVGCKYAGKQEDKRENVAMPFQVREWKSSEPCYET